MPQPVDVIHVRWSGPHSPDWVLENAKGKTDYGVYQLYGTHAVFGADSLLYIGKAFDRPFSKRIADHKNDWFAIEPNAVSIFLGRPYGDKKFSEEQYGIWEDEIDRIERLLISNCTPPYNSRNIYTPGEICKPTLVLNYERRNRLPFAVCSDSCCIAIGDSSYWPYEAE